MSTHGAEVLLSDSLGCSQVHPLIMLGIALSTSGYTEISGNSYSFPCPSCGFEQMAGRGTDSAAFSQNLVLGRGNM